MSKRIIINKELLEKLYEQEKKSTYCIAKIIKCNASVIQKRLKEYNLNVRNKKEKIIISKSLLKRMYIDEKLSSYKIANKLKIGRTTIYNKLINLNISTRKKKLIKISKNKLIKLYYSKKYPLSKIGKLYGFSSAGILKKMNYYNIKRRYDYESNTIYTKKEFSGNEELKAYMIGFRLGDLNFVKLSKNSPNFKLNTSTTKKEQINLIKKIFGSYGHFYCKKIGGSYNIHCDMDKSFSFLLPKEDNIPNWILLNDNNFLAFLGGYIDAEGNFGIYQNRARFRIGSYDKNILYQLSNKLNRYGINTKFRLETKKGVYNKKKLNKDFYRVSINDKRSLLIFIDCIQKNVRHEKRYKDMMNAKNNILIRNKNSN